MITFTFIGRKGGITKSTQAVNIAAACAISGLRTLIVDCDSQASASEVLGLKSRNGLFHLIGENFEFADVVEKVHERFTGGDYPLYAISGGEYTAVLEKDINVPGIMVDRMDEARDFIDVMIFDTPPGIGEVVVGTYFTADYAILPTTCEFESILSLDKTLSYLQNAMIEGKKAGFKAAEILAISPAKFRAAESVQRSNIGFIKGRYYQKVAVMDGVRELTGWRQSAQHRQSIWAYWPDDDYSVRDSVQKARKDFKPLVNLVLETVKGVPA